MVKFIPQRRGVHGEKIRSINSFLNLCVLCVFVPPREIFSKNVYTQSILGGIVSALRKLRLKPSLTRRKIKD